MGKRISKAIILREALDRVTAAQTHVESAERVVAQTQAVLETAKAVRDAHVLSYKALADSLGSTSPDVAAPKSPPAPSAGKQSRRDKKTDPPPASIGTEKDAATDATKNPVCAVPLCGLEERYAVHQEGVGMPDYHPFQAAKTKGAGA